MKTTFACVVLLLTSISHAALMSLGNVLTMGDSITEGFNESVPFPGGFRDPLYQDLTNAGFSFQFVGDRNTNPSSLLISAGQTAHDGLSGYEINNDPVHGRSGIDEYYNQTMEGVNHIQANWILLMIGGNDVDQLNLAGAGQRYTNLLNDIHTANPTAHIICSSIIPNLDGGTRSADRLTFNGEVQQDVLAAQQLGWNVSFADVGNVIDPSTDMIDPLHPNLVGTDLIAQGWTNAIEAAVPEPTIFLILPAFLLLLNQRQRTPVLCLNLA